MSVIYYIGRYWRVTLCQYIHNITPIACLVSCRMNFSLYVSVSLYLSVPVLSLWVCMSINQSWWTTQCRQCCVNRKWNPPRNHRHCISCQPCLLFPIHSYSSVPSRRSGVLHADSSLSLTYLAHAATQFGGRVGRLTPEGRVSAYIDSNRATQVWRKSSWQLWPDNSITKFYSIATHLYKKIRDDNSLLD